MDNKELREKILQILTVLDKKGWSNDWAIDQVLEIIKQQKSQIIDDQIRYFGLPEDTLVPIKVKVLYNYLIIIKNQP